MNIQINCAELKNSISRELDSIWWKQRLLLIVDEGDLYSETAQVLRSGESAKFIFSGYQNNFTLQKWYLKDDEKSKKDGVIEYYKAYLTPDIWIREWGQTLDDSINPNNCDFYVFLAISRT